MDNYASSFFLMTQAEPRLVQSNACTTHSQCTAIWKEEWWNRVAWQILHPDTPCYGEELLTLLEDADIPGLCTWCKEAMLTRIKDSDTLRNDTMLQDIAVMEVMDIQTDVWHNKCTFIPTVFRVPRTAVHLARTTLACCTNHILASIAWHNKCTYIYSHHVCVACTAFVSVQTTFPHVARTTCTMLCHFMTWMYGHLISIYSKERSVE